MTITTKEPPHGLQPGDGMNTESRDQMNTNSVQTTVTVITDPHGLGEFENGDEGPQPDAGVILHDGRYYPYHLVPDPHDVDRPDDRIYELTSEYGYVSVARMDPGVTYGVHAEDDYGFGGGSPKASGHMRTFAHTILAAVGLANHLNHELAEQFADEADRQREASKPADEPDKAETTSSLTEKIWQIYEDAATDGVSTAADQRLIITLGQLLDADETDSRTTLNPDCAD